MSEEEKRSRRWKTIITVATLVALALLMYVVRDQIAETVTNLSRVNMYALLLIIPAQMLSYDATARMYRYLFIVLRHHLSYKFLLKISLEMNFVNNVFPSGGVSGFSYFGLRLRSSDISVGQATLVQVFRFILLFISFQVLLLAGLFLLALGGQANSFMLLIAGSLVTLLLLGTMATAFIVGSKKRINTFFTYITRMINKFIHLVRPNHPETINIKRVQRVFTDLHEGYTMIKDNPSVLKKPLLYSLLMNVAEILTVYAVFVAFGEWVNPGAVIIAYAIANFAGLISVLPGGVGIYEALMTAVLASAGVPPGVSIPVIIMYRVLSMLLQLPPGYILYHRAVQDDGVRA